MPTAVATPPTTDPAWLVRELTSAYVLSDEQSSQLLKDVQQAGLGRDAAGLASSLVEAGLLTTYQSEKALVGEAGKLAIGPYLLLEPIGSGSLGMVYRALNRRNRQRYAVKILPLRSMWNVVQAKRQVQIFAALPKHPAVVPFVDIDTAAGSHYLAWPFVEGESFGQLVRRRGPLPPAHVVQFLTDVADGLDLCQQRGVVHGLLKPTNLLLGPDRKAHVLDFGIGAILSDNIADDESLLDTISTANTAMGMMDFAAPETLVNPTSRTPAGDMYSFGCVLYYLLTGSLPFPDGNAVDKILAHQTQEPAPVRDRNPAVPRPLSDLVGHLMRKNPAERPRRMAEVRDRLRGSVPESERTTAELPKTAIELWAAKAALANNEVAKNWQAETISPAPAVTPPVRGENPDDSVSFDIPKLEATSAAMPAPDLKLSPLDVAANRPPAGEALPPPVPLQLETPPPPRRSDGSGDAPTGRPRPANRNRIDVTLPPRPVAWEEHTVLPGHVTSATAAVPPRRLTSKVRRFFRKLCFWMPPRDVVQISVFGPRQLSPGETTRLQVYAHPPGSFGSVRTLSRAFQPDTELIASGFADVLIPRDGVLGLHLAVANAGIAKSLVRFRWVGQTRPWAFEVYVPWESPAGRTPAMLSIGLNDVQIGEVPFEVEVLPRQG